MKEIVLRHAADHDGQGAQILNTEPRIGIYGNEFKWSKRKIFGPSGLDTAPVWQGYNSKNARYVIWKVLRE